MGTRKAKVTQLAWDDHVSALMQPSIEASPWAMVSGFANVLANAHLFEVHQGASRVLLAMRGTEREHGRLLEVVGMRSLGERVRASETVAVVEQIARDCYERVDLLSMTTRHAHLAAGCVRMGWAEAGTVVNKALRLQ